MNTVATTVVSLLRRADAADGDGKLVYRIQAAEVAEDLPSGPLKASAFIELILSATQAGRNSLAARSYRRLQAIAEDDRVPHRLRQVTARISPLALEMFLLQPTADANVLAGAFEDAERLMERAGLDRTLLWRPTAAWLDHQGRFEEAAVLYSRLRWEPPAHSLHCSSAGHMAWARHLARQGRYRIARAVAREAGQLDTCSHDRGRCPAEAGGQFDVALLSGDLDDVVSVFSDVWGWSEPSDPWTAERVLIAAGITGHWASGRQAALAVPAWLDQEEVEWTRSLIRALAHFQRAAERAGVTGVTGVDASVLRAAGAADAAELDALVDAWDDADAERFGFDLSRRTTDRLRRVLSGVGM